MERYQNKKRTLIIIGVAVLMVITSVISYYTGVIRTHIKIASVPKYSIEFNQEAVAPENIKKFEQVKYLMMSKYYEPVDENTLIEGAIAGMAYSVKDRYTSYYTKEQMQQLMETTQGSYVGIGVSVGMDENNLLTVLEVFKESPARNSGIKKGDKIVKVDDEDVTLINDISLIVDKIKGVEDTVVKLKVYRPAEKNYLDFSIPRKKIEGYNVASEVLNDIGYIRLRMFDDNVARDFKAHLKQLMDSGIKGLIIDLRDNPGGDYYEVIEIADRIVPKGIIVYTEDKDKRQDIKRSDNEELELPLAVLINENSASASEILSAAVKEHHKGTLIGKTTFGKGLVQQIIPLEDGSGIKLTIANYFTPAHKSIHGIGVEPDIEIDIAEEYKYSAIYEIPQDKDSQLQKAIEVLKQQIQ